MSEENYKCGIEKIKKENRISRSAFKKLTLSQTKKRKYVTSELSINNLHTSSIDQLNEIREIVNFIDPIITTEPISSIYSFAKINKKISNEYCDNLRPSMKNQNDNATENKLVINKIRKCKNFDAKIINDEKNESYLAPNDIFLNKENDIVSLSSGDGFQSIQNSQKVIETTIAKGKISKNKKHNTENTIKKQSTVKSRLDKEFSKISQNYKKIDSFFTPIFMQNNNSKNSAISHTSQVITDQNSNKHIVKFEIGVPINSIKKLNIERKLTKHMNLLKINKKYFTNGQQQFPNFFLQRKDDSLIGYYTTVKNTLFPIIISGELDISNFLTILINDDDNDNVLNKWHIIDDQKYILVSPRSLLDIKMFEKIDTKLSQQKINDKILYIKNFVNTDSDILVEEINNQFFKSFSDCEVVETTFDDIVELLDSDDQKKNTNTKVLKDPVSRKKLAKQKKLNNITKLPKIKKKNAKRKHACPKYKIIAGTTFAVDAFRFGDIDGVTDYFLTHFHADHYIGLTKGFHKPIYLSEITARLVRHFIKTSDEFLRIIEINKPFILNNIEITALDANHCPGAIVLIFKFLDGKCILHTGDFRASPEMEEEPFYWNNDIDTVYLDTTYLTSKYDFQGQWDSIHYILSHIDHYIERNIGNKFLIVCGSYLIGKEKVWLNIAYKFNLKVWLEPKRRQAINCINDQMMIKVVVDEPQNANIHVLTMGNINYNYLTQYRKQYDDLFTNIIAIRPSGWEKNSKAQYRDTITIIGVEYSEHSSYNELKRFVRFLRPNHVISTVPYGQNITRTPKIPNNWMLQEVKPMLNGYQPSITNYLKIMNTKILDIDSNFKTKKREENNQPLVEINLSHK